jgi:putative DNA primase/helicase
VITGAGYQEKRKEVQRRMIFTGLPPENVKQAEWLSSQVKQFRDKLKGDHDVPPVL